MHRSLMIVAPFLVLSACTLKVDGQDDTAETGATETSTETGTETAGHSSDPQATEGATEGTEGSRETETGASEATTTTGKPTGDHPANDNCVPRDPPNDPPPSTTGGEETSNGGGDDSGGSTAGGGGTGGDDGEGEGSTAGGSDTDGWDTNGQECDPLPPEFPAPEDFDCMCNISGEHRACEDGEGQKGTRFCDGEAWGPCVAEPECMPGTYEVCFHCDEQFGTALMWCEVFGGVPTYPNQDDCNTPLVLSFDGRRVEYTSAHAEFAMTASDQCGVRDWPTAATPWLAIDLDRNGNIDGGHELFGSGSRLGGVGRPQNGFVALAALDSDGDGKLSASDERFGELVLWGDEDADRRSTLWELQPLASHGIVSIDLEYAMPASQCDARGNCEVERARFVFADEKGVQSSGEVIDVRLSCQ